MADNRQYTQTINLLGATAHALSTRKDKGLAKFDFHNARITPLDAAKLLNDFKTELLVQVKGGPSPTSGELRNTIDLVDAVLHGNLLLIDMGPLNLKQSISPNVAKAHIKTLNELRGQLQTILAEILAAEASVRPAPSPEPQPQPQPGPSPEPTPLPTPSPQPRPQPTPIPAPTPTPASKPKLNGIGVDGADPLEDGLYWAVHDSNMTVSFTAILSPNDPTTAQRLKWSGAYPVPGKPTESFMPLDQISRFDTPLCVSATLDDQTVQVRLIVVPELKALTEVADTAKLSSSIPTGARVLLAHTRPDTSDAYAFLDWQGGDDASSAGLGANYRLVSAATGESTDKLDVSVGIRVP